MTSEITPSCLIVIPCLNEEEHIGPLLDALARQAETIDARIVVADGGSIDATRAIVGAKADGNRRIALLHNPMRIQSAGINAAVAAFGDGIDCMVRVDAHGTYPDDYCLRLVEEAARTGAASVVVSMKTMGTGIFQRATAEAQNSRLGNGGSLHRSGGGGGWVDHGHHALMRIEPFRAVGGYDETFSHNEDAELDFRLRKAGYRIWMTGRTTMTYYPRDTVGGLFRQYLSYGRGRAMNVMKHRVVPKIRQMLPLMVVPVLVLATFSVFSWLALVPAAVWAFACLGYGLALAVRQGRAQGALVGISAMIMHVGWSLGFWLQLLSGGRGGKAA